MQGLGTAEALRVSLELYTALDALAPEVGFAIHDREVAERGQRFANARACASSGSIASNETTQFRPRDLAT